MEVKDKKSKKEIWKEISRDFWALCRELRLWWFPQKVVFDQTDENEREPLMKEVDGTAKSEEKTLPEDAKVQKKKVGMFYYAEDKSFSEELIPNKTVSGVVYHVDKKGKHGLVVLLHQAWLPWSSDDLYVGLFKTNKFNGKKNTRFILKIARKLGQKAEAAEYCANYAYDGVKAGEAFLPSIEELKYLYKNKWLVDGKLALIKDADLLDDWYYWSSSEFHNFNSAISQSFHSGSVYGCNNLKYCSYYSVRPVVAF